MKTWIIVACIIACSCTCLAGTREDAKDALALLKQKVTNHTYPDEMASIETTFTAAERFSQQNNAELAQRYYLLSLQKARILLNSLPLQTKVTLPSPTAPPELPVKPAFSPLSSPTKKPQAAPEKMPTVTAPPAAPAKPSADADDDDSEDDFTSDNVTSDKLIGNANTYTVQRHENIRLVAAKLGVTRDHLMQMNGLTAKSVLKAGQQLKYNNRKIIPQHITNGIVINIPDRTLYYFKNGKLATSLPVALGVAAKTKKFDWKTPTGKFKIVAKQKDPTWYVPPSIQEEMEDEGKEVIISIPPGPSNPLGKYAVKTSLPGILIHSTTKPGSIYSFASHGCIRVYPAHMEEFFKEVKVNTHGEIIYRPVKLAVTEQGRIFLEVHHDVYGKAGKTNDIARQLIEKQNLSDRVNWDKVKLMIKQKAGLAEDITL